MTTSHSLQSKKIRIAGIISLLGNLLLAVIKLYLAKKANSIAVLGDGLDSASDVLIALVTLIISFIIEIPGDTEHPWGHYRAETTATMLLSFIIFLAGSQLCISSAKEIILFFLNKSNSLKNTGSFFAILAALISICGKSVLAIILHYYGKISKSEIIKANALNMKSDILLSFGILLGLSAEKIFNIPLIDPAVAFLVGLWITKNAVELFLDLNRELMDGNKDKALYKKLFNAAVSVPGVTNPHGARIRKLANLYAIDLDIEVNPTLTVYEAHEKAEEVEEAIRSAIPDIYNIMIHIEPWGSDAHQRKEEFGLSPDKIDEI